MAVYKDTAILFGGVFDEDMNDEVMVSTCYNEMYDVPVLPKSVMYLGN
jgi:hypothetical protein